MSIVWQRHPKKRPPAYQEKDSSDVWLFVVAGALMWLAFAIFD